MSLIVTKLHFLSPVLDSLFPIVMIPGAGRAAGGFTIEIGCDLREREIWSKI